MKFVEEADPYDLSGFTALLRSAGKHSRAEDGGIAVVISRHPCLMDRTSPPPDTRSPEIHVNDKCKGCDFCLKQFECPAMYSQGEKHPVGIDANTCTRCGVCVSVCPHGALETNGTDR